MAEELLLTATVTDLRAEPSTSELSNVTIDGVQQTWHQLYEREKAERERLEAFRRMIADLSRCEHGRHQGDSCFGCGGVSKGNPRIDPGDALGYNISARPYIVPTRWELTHIEAWRGGGIG